MKLELKHIASYLPYGLKVQWTNKEGETNVLHTIGLRDGGILSYDDNREPPRHIIELCVCYKLKNRNNGYFFVENFKPILRPLSDLKKEIDGKVGITELLKDCCFNTDKMSMDEQLEYMDTFMRIQTLDFTNAMWLFEHHYDVYGLIEQGLAVDINTLKL